MDVMEFYKSYSRVTDPGKYGRLYAGLPRDLVQLCRIVKAQLIHPFGDAGKYPELAKLGSEDETMYSVEDMLAELERRNPRGLVLDRLPAERLRLSCRFHSILLASILKSQGVPARLRVGFAKYLSPPGVDMACDHWICEIWDQRAGKWIFADPDKEMVDFDRKEFELSGDVWLNVIDKKADPGRYGVWKWTGLDYIKANLLHDRSCVMNNELIYWEGPALAQKKCSGFSAGDYELLSEIALLLHDADRNWKRLNEIGSDSRLGGVGDYPRYKE